MDNKPSKSKKKHINDNEEFRNKKFWEEVDNYEMEAPQRKKYLAGFIDLQDLIQEYLTAKYNSNPDFLTENCTWAFGLEIYNLEFMAEDAQTKTQDND